MIVLPVLMEIDAGVVLENGRVGVLAIDRMIEVIKDIAGDEDGRAVAFVAGGDGVRVTAVDRPFVLARGIKPILGDISIAAEIDMLVTGELVEGLVSAIQHKLPWLTPASAVGIEIILMAMVPVDVVIIDPPMDGCG